MHQIHQGVKGCHAWPKGSLRRMRFSDQSNDNLSEFAAAIWFWRDSPPPPQWVRTSSFTRFLDHTQRRAAVGRTPLDEWSVRIRDLYLTTRNTHTRYACFRWDFVFVKCVVISCKSRTLDTRVCNSQAKRHMRDSSLPVRYNGLCKTNE